MQSRDQRRVHEALLVGGVSGSGWYTWHFTQALTIAQFIWQFIWHFYPIQISFLTYIWCFAILQSTLCAIPLLNVYRAQCSCNCSLVCLPLIIVAAQPSGQLTFQCFYAHLCVVVHTAWWQYTFNTLGPKLTMYFVIVSLVCPWIDARCLAVACVSCPIPCDLRSLVTFGVFLKF